MVDDNNDVLQMYLDELECIEEFDKITQMELLEKINGGDNTSRNKLIEGKLKFVMTLLREYMNRGISVQELIGEANLLLVSAIDNYKEGDLDEHIKLEVTNGLAEIIEQAEYEKSGEDSIAEKANNLAETSKNMALELGREAKIEELAKKAELSEEEVKTLMKMTLQAMED